MLGSSAVRRLERFLDRSGLFVLVRRPLTSPFRQYWFTCREMQPNLCRTGVTDLTDAELLLFDIIATRGGTYRVFHPDVFPLQYNYPSHELDAQTLVDTLRRFESIGWTGGVNFVDQGSRSNRSIRITNAGAELWEAERRPDWTRFVMEWYGRSIGDSARHRVSVLGHSPSVCRQFFDVLCECGFFDYDGGRVLTASAQRRLIYWRPKQTVYLVSAWLNSWHNPTDWLYFQMHRTWWRFPDEIGTLWEFPSAED